MRKYYDDFKEFYGKTALVLQDGVSVNYEQLDQSIEQYAKWFQDRKLVFCFCDNEAGAICAYVACLRYHMVPLLLKKELEEELRNHLLQVYKPAWVIAPKEIAGEFSEGLEKLTVRDYSLFEMKHRSSVSLHPDLALLLTTSGSTGSPKLVRQSDVNVQSNAESIAQYLELDSNERPITTLPMSYTYGLSIINSHLLVGATILLTTKTWMQREFWEFFQEQGATSFGGVPYSYQMLKRLHFFKKDLPELKTMTQAGGKLSPELHREFAQYAKEHNKKFIVMYGQTEATARMAYLPAKFALEKYGSMGIAIPGGKLSLRDVKGEEIEQPDVVGELVYEGPNVTMGYALQPEDLEKNDERNGVLVTGDMAKRDSDGFYYIVGRKKRFLKLFGNRLNLDEIETMVTDGWQDVECASCGVDDHMYVFVAAEETMPVEEICNYIAEKVKIHSSAFCVKQIPVIPKNEAGKKQYGKLEEWFDE